MIIIISVVLLIKFCNLKRKNNISLIVLVFALLLVRSISISAQQPAFKVLAFYSTNVERDHVQFADDIIPFYQKLAKEKNFVFDTTTKWTNLNDDTLKN